MRKLNKSRPGNVTLHLRRTFYCQAQDDDDGASCMPKSGRNSQFHCRVACTSWHGYTTGNLSAYEFAVVGSCTLILPMVHYKH